MQPELHAVTDAVCCLEPSEVSYSNIQIRSMHDMPCSMQIYHQTDMQHTDKYPSMQSFNMQV